MSDVFGNFFVASQLEEEAIAALRKWFPTYLRHLEGQLSLPVGGLKAPPVYTNRNSLDMISGDDMPTCVVISPGLLDEPITREVGNYTASWSLGVAIALAAENEDDANRFAKIYGAVTRGLLLQKLVRESTAVIRVDWLDERYEDLPFDDQIQQFRAASVYFSVEVENIVSKYTGPSVPDEDPYPDYETVDEVIITTDRLF
jgi:hypothetical protein